LSHGMSELYQPGITNVFCPGVDCRGEVRCLGKRCKPRRRAADYHRFPVHSQCIRAVPVCSPSPFCQPFCPFQPVCHSGNHQLQLKICIPYCIRHSCLCGIITACRMLSCLFCVTSSLEHHVPRVGHCCRAGPPRCDAAGAAFSSLLAHNSDNITCHPVTKLPQNGGSRCEMKWMQGMDGKGMPTLPHPKGKIVEAIDNAPFKVRLTRPGDCTRMDTLYMVHRRNKWQAISNW
jgi:hypothetical protein